MELKEGYKQTEVGVIPEDWESQRIDAHALITTKPEHVQDRVDNGAHLSSSDPRKLFELTHSHEGEAVLTAGDGVGTGKVFHYVNGRFDVHQRVYRITDFDDDLSGNISSSNSVRISLIESCR